jgi:pimeloyl-ACP methyl ester carboxylesterase
MAQIDRDGVRLSYAVHGSDHPRTTILLSHGYGATSQMWEPNLEALGAHHRVITWDLRGHGRSDSPPRLDQYSEQLSVEDMAAILDAVGVDRAVIGGLSLGGYLSLAFALAHPERVAALMLFDTGPGYRRDEGREEWNRSAIARAEAFESSGLEALSSGAEVRRAVHRDPLGLARAARGILTQHDARVIESLPSIRVPTLVLVGEQDQAFRAAADYMADRISGATKVVLAGAGHASNLDQPEAFNQSVLSFLEGLP